MIRNNVSTIFITRWCSFVLVTSFNSAPLIVWPTIKLWSRSTRAPLTCVYVLLLLNWKNSVPIQRITLITCGRCCMPIKVLKPGLATTVQDTGREGFYHLGIPPSGGLDHYALRMANLLVGNSEDAAVLEVTLMGPELEFSEDARVAVSGARMSPRLDGVPMPLDTAFRVRSGQALRFDFATAGC